MGEVFISYKHEERTRMRPIAEGLRTLGVDVWFDEQLQPDRSFTEEITEVIHGCRAQLVCWSPTAAKSEWVRGEAEIGRQRGVLISAVIEPCSLLPPFNMLHAENLSDWTGDARHPGWRKIVDSVGRKLDRPGLGELAALQASSDPAAWKKWAQKYPADPQADAAWANAEELEIAAARERVARERDVVRRAAEQAPAALPPPISQAPAPEQPPRNTSRVAPLAGAGALAAVIAAAVFVLSRLAPGMPSSQSATISATPAATSDKATTAPLSDRAQALAAPATQAAAIGETSPHSSAAAPASAASAPDPAAALAALGRISAREWSMLDGSALVQRVLSQAPLASLRAAAASDAQAQTVLGIAYNRGVGGVARNDAEAVRLFRLAADQRLARAQFSLGFVYANGVGVARNDVEAARLYRLAASQGLARAQHNLGVLYEDGRGVARSEANAVRLYRLAADQGAAEAQFALGLMYEHGRGVTPNDAEAARLYRLAAEQGLASAQRNLGLMYKNGRGVVRSDAEAVRLFRLASTQGNASAQYNLGVMFEDGRGVARSDAEAVRFFRLAADQGYASARNSLGLMYAHGRGVRQDDAEAVRLYRLAASQGDAAAQSNLGFMYGRGRGVARDDVEAVRLYRLAADQQLARGQYNLGVMYENGLGGLRADRAEAVRLYRLAARQDYESAQAALRRLGETW